MLDGAEASQRAHIGLTPARRGVVVLVMRIAVRAVFHLLVKAKSAVIAVVGFRSRGAQQLRDRRNGALFPEEHQCLGSVDAYPAILVLEHAEQGPDVLLCAQRGQPCRCVRHVRNRALGGLVHLPCHPAGHRCLSGQHREDHRARGVQCIALLQQVARDVVVRLEVVKQCGIEVAGKIRQQQRRHRVQSRAQRRRVQGQPCQRRGDGKGCLVHPVHGRQPRLVVGR